MMKLLYAGISLVVIVVAIQLIGTTKATGKERSFSFDTRKSHRDVAPQIPDEQASSNSCDQGVGNNSEGCDNIIATYRLN